MAPCSRRKKIVKKFGNRGYRLNTRAIDKILIFADPFTHKVDEDLLLDRLLDNLLEESRMPLLPLLYIEYFLIVHGEASAKTKLYRERFMLLRQRVSRSEHFSRLAFDAETSRFKKHKMVLGEKSEQKVCEFGGTTCFNPGSFSTDSTYVAYRPSTQDVKLSAL